MKKNLSRGLQVIITAGAFIIGANGMASANNSISNTGPHSTAQISSSHTTDCRIENNTDVSFRNRVNQDAETGNATVGGGWGDWGSWDPSVWHSKGHSYEDWHNAMSGYMNEMKHKWAGSGGGNTHGGDAVSGDATNNNTAAFNVAIKNDGLNCFGFPNHVSTGGGSGGGVGSSTTSPHGGTGAHHVLGGSGGAHGSRGSQASPHKSSQAGGHGGPAMGHTAGGHGGAMAPSAHKPAVHKTSQGGGGHGAGTSPGTGSVIIGPTGPDSSVHIDSSVDNKVKIVNNNSVDIDNKTYQTAETGNANVSGNTTGGDAETGPATNHNSAVMNLIIAN